MIYTLTTNPAIDYYLNINTFSVGTIHRSDSESFCFGGKGINVSLVLKELGISSVATGFLAGFTGMEIQNGLNCDKINTDFVMLERGHTRINVKIRACEETDINASGPVITDNDIQKLLSKLDLLKQGDILVLAGNVQNSLPNNFYQIIMERLSSNRIKFIVDAERDCLTSCLKHKPFLIKPNDKELSDIFGVEIDTHETALKYAKELQKMGALNVLVSLGEKGAVLVDEFGKEHITPAHTGKAINTVGAGDSTVAGFLAGYLEKNDYEYALHLGCAAGSATAFTEGLATKDDILKLL